MCSDSLHLSNEIKKGTILACPCRIPLYQLVIILFGCEPGKPVLIPYRYRSFSCNTARTGYVRRKIIRHLEREPQQ